MADDPAIGQHELAWTRALPEAPGLYWYHHPASHELPSLVRVAWREAGLAVHFPGVGVCVPVRMLTGGRWAVAVPGTRQA